MRNIDILANFELEIN
jgi:hypothetical protein